MVTTMAYEPDGPMCISILLASHEDDEVEAFSRHKQLLISQRELLPREICCGVEVLLSPDEGLELSLRTFARVPPRWFSDW